MPRVIDEKGRLFGKINIVDLFIIVFILSIVLVFFYAYSTLKEEPVIGKFKWVEVEAVVFTIPEIAGFFAPGDFSYDLYGKPDGELLKILKKDEWYGEKLKACMAGPLEYKYRIPVFCKFKLACTKNALDGLWYFHGAPFFISLEYPFLFDTDKYRIWCYAIKIED